MEVTIPCGQCIGCKLEYSRQWAVRCVHELKHHNYSEYMTLTYDDDNLPADGSLNKSDMQLFMKKLRHYAHPLNIRFFQCGEYGEETMRPHHHAIIFGYEMPDRKHLKTVKGIDYYSSEILNALWGKGHVTLGDVTFESCAYVARYVVKKHIQQIDESLVKPYITMSRRPGIGMNHLKKFADEIYNTDSIVIRGRQCKPPKAYDAAFKDYDPKQFLKVKRERSASTGVPDLSILERKEKYQLELTKQKGKRNEH